MVLVTVITQKMRMIDKNRKNNILEKANELIKSIASGIAWLKESDQALGGKPTIMFLKFALDGKKSIF